MAGRRRGAAPETVCEHVRQRLGFQLFGTEGMLGYGGDDQQIVLEDLGSAEVGAQSHGARRAKGARLPAADLRRHAQRREVALRDDHRLDRLMRITGDE